MENIIKALNKLIQETRINKECTSFLLDIESIVPNRKFKVFKEYTIKIYIVRQYKSAPILLMEETKIFNSSVEESNNVHKELVQKLIIKLFKLIQTDNWDKIIKGNYEEMEK